MSPFYFVNFKTTEHNPHRMDLKDLVLLLIPFSNFHPGKLLPILKHQVKYVIFNESFSNCFLPLHCSP